MICILGGTGAGKTSVSKVIQDNYDLPRIIIYTTRPMRQGEINGIDYRFITENKFQYMLKNGEFIETAQHREWNYGTAIKDCMNDRIMVTTPEGFRNLKKIPDLKIQSVYLNVPCRDRLIKILQRGDDIWEAYRRILSETRQFEGIENEVDFVVDNAGYKYSPSDIAMMIMIRRGEKH